MAGIDANVLVPLALAAAGSYLAVIILGRGPTSRALTAALCILFSLRYIWWRWNDSMPVGQMAWQQTWAWVFLVFETMGNVSSMIAYGFLSRTRSRSADADAGADSSLLQAPVDVLIATYNEGRDILERTIVAALHIDHPDLRVWVLDDGARPWVRELAESLGSHYTFRVKSQHAKAGNVNAGLAVACATGRSPHFILLLDADFTAGSTILKRTLPLFKEDDVGIVQTPQHFFNPDPVQSNLLCAHAWPDEQRFFFNYLLASKDAWGAAFCCGTSAVFRVTALQACGGMATETVTEDMLTTFRMRDYGYRTIFLNEQLSMGLAAEGLQEYISQRARWCLGAMQQIYTRWSFAGPARIGLVNRISCLDGVLFWSSNFAFKLMMISAPFIYWWTSTAVMNCSISDLLYWLAPQIVCGMIFMGCFAGNRVVPVLTDVMLLLPSIAIVRTVAIGLVKPFGHPFKVTAKGLSTNRVTVQWSFLAPFLALAGGTGLGMLWNTSPYSPLAGTDGYAVNMVWSVFNIAVLCIAAAVCVELPRRRRDDRFPADEPASIAFGSTQSACRVRNISLGGAALERADGWNRPAEYGTISLRDIANPIPIQQVGTDEDGTLTVRFLASDEVRHELLRKLYTGQYHIELPRVRVGRAIWSITTRVFA